MTRPKNTLRVKSLDQALNEFLGAPAAHGLDNEGIVEKALGGRRVKDPAAFDPIREKYEKLDATSFDKAFKAAWGGKRDWREFDLEALQQCVNGELAGLQLPERVERLIQQQAASDYQDRVEGEYMGVEPLPEPPPDVDAEETAPPVELLRRGAPRSRKRRIKGTRRQIRKQYEAVKEMYHQLGEALRATGEKTKRRKRR